MDDQIRNKAVDELFQLLYVAMEFEQGKRKYETDVDISSSEIYLLMRISNTSKANVTVLAGLLGISKSAVSQAIKKLKEKKLITIDIDPDNESRYIIGLSEKGEVAHKAHMARRHSLNEKLGGALDQFDEKTCREMRQFFMESKDILTDFV
jgi:DNA-binding MarR family transcriptional regulator